jgi:hypothetical protein
VLGDSKTLLDSSTPVDSILTAYFIAFSPLAPKARDKPSPAAAAWGAEEAAEGGDGCIAAAKHARHTVHVGARSARA